MLCLGNEGAVCRDSSEVQQGRLSPVVTEEHSSGIRTVSSPLPWVRCPSYVSSEKPESRPSGLPKALVELSALLCSTSVNILCGVTVKMNSLSNSESIDVVQEAVAERQRLQFYQSESLDANSSTDRQEMEGLSVGVFLCQSGNISINDGVILRFVY